MGSGRLRACRTPFPEQRFRHPQRTVEQAYPHTQLFSLCGSGPLLVIPPGIHLAGQRLHAFIGRKFCIHQADEAFSKVIVKSAITCCGWYASDLPDQLTATGIGVGSTMEQHRALAVVFPYRSQPVVSSVQEHYPCLRRRWLGGGDGRSSCLGCRAGRGCRGRIDSAIGGRDCDWAGSDDRCRNNMSVTHRHAIRRRGSGTQLADCLAAASLDYWHIVSFLLHR